jgi:GTP pyrophosphokinase
MDLWQEEWLEKIAQRASFLSTEDLLVSIGFGGITASYVAGRLRDEWKKLNQPVEQIQLEDLITGQAEPKPISGVRVKGVENVLVRFARCCNPVPGDPIIGYITKGHGVFAER